MRSWTLTLECTRLWLPCKRSSKCGRYRHRRHWRRWRHTVIIERTHGRLSWPLRSSFTQQRRGANSYEAEDIGLSFGMISPPPGSGHGQGHGHGQGQGHYGGSAGGIGSRVGNSTSSLRASGGRSGLYYSPPGTSYTIVERPHSPHYYYNSAGVPTKGGSLPGRGSAYLSSSPSSHMAAGTAGTLPTSTAASGRHGSSAMGNGNKKRPISPEQVLRMFGATQSSSVPTSSYHYSNGGTRDRDRDRDRTGRRSPASSPPSTTHQVNEIIM